MNKLQHLQYLSKLGNQENKVNWTPQNLGSALAFWVDANNISSITLNGSTVSQWDDLSGNSRHLTQATPANQPTLITGANNEVRSDGTDDVMSSPSFSLTQPFARFSVLTRRTTNTGSILNSLSGNPNIPLTNHSATQIQTFAGNVGIVSNQTFSNGQTSQFGEIFNGASSSLFNNGTETTGNLGTNGMNGVRISGGTILTTGFHSVLVMNRLPTTDERQRIEGYLAHRYGIQSSLPAGHPYLVSPPKI